MKAATALLLHCRTYRLLQSCNKSSSVKTLNISDSNSLCFFFSTEPVKRTQSHGKSRSVSTGPSDPSPMQSPFKAGVSNGAGSHATSENHSRNTPDVKEQKCFISVMGMTCASCVANIERNLLKHRGKFDLLTKFYMGHAEYAASENLQPVNF